MYSSCVIFSVSAVFKKNDLPSVPYSTHERIGLNLLFHEAVDISLDFYSLTPLRYDFMRPTPYYRIQPYYFILGSTYPKAHKYDFVKILIQAINTFDSTFWSLLLFTLIALPFLLSFLKTFNCQKSRRRTYLQRFRFKFGKQFLFRKVKRTNQSRSFKSRLAFAKTYFEQLCILLTAVVCSASKFWHSYFNLWKWMNEFSFYHDDQFSLHTIILY